MNQTTTDKIAEIINKHNCSLKKYTIHIEFINDLADLFEEEDKKEATRYLRTFGRNWKESLRFNKEQFLKTIGVKK